MSLPGFSESPARLPPLGDAATLLTEALSHRTELTALEFAEAQAAGRSAALLLAVAAGLGLLAGFAFTLLVAALVWDGPHRGGWLAGLCAAYLLGGAIAALTLGRRLRTWRPFAEIRAQLRQDHQCLRQLIKQLAR